MNISNYKKYACFDYVSNYSENPFKLGDVVIKPLECDGEICNEIGIVLQIHDNDELRTDMFGNECIEHLRIPTIGEVKKYRPSILSDITTF